MPSDECFRYDGQGGFAASILVNIPIDFEGLLIGTMTVSCPQQLTQSILTDLLKTIVDQVDR